MAKKKNVNASVKDGVGQEALDTVTQTGKSGGVKNQIDEFRNKVEDLKNKGFVPLGSFTLDSGNKDAYDRECVSLSRRNAEIIGGAVARASFGMFDGKQSNPVPVSGVGTPGLGYIPWGPDNQLPNIIFNNSENLPYTAAALKYVADLTVGLGPKLMYKYGRYAGGTVSEEYIPYELAGEYLINRIREVKNKIAIRDAETNQGNHGTTDKDRTSGNREGRRGDSSTTILWGDAINGILPIIDESENPENEPGTLEFELKRLKDDYEIWMRDSAEIEKFIEENNLGLHYMKCTVDDVHMDIYIPTIGLSVGRPSEPWNPKIVRVGHLPDVCSRLEQMDSNYCINYVYYSERWRQDATVELETKDIVAYPAISFENLLSDLRGLVERNKNKRILKNRPTWVACPIYYPSMLKPYYPQPAWWSIFPCGVYEYASTLITDKAIVRRNATMFSKIIFINQEYLEKLYSLMGDDSVEKQMKRKNEILRSVNEFLKDRANNGKNLCLDSFMGPDNKTMQHSVEIVDVPRPSSGADTKNELEEISSIIFFAIGVHPALIGAVPGRSGSSGGTYQRELQLLKQNQLAPRQHAYLNFLQSIHRFNGWDKHGVWTITQQVLTTLDRSKTGIEETNLS